MQGKKVHSSTTLASPRYAVVAQALTEDILSGRYPVGSNLPTENELCKQFDISRHTTREAIRRLQMKGLVSRRAGVGTTVRSNSISQRYIQTGDTVSDLHKYAQDIVLEVLETSDIEANAETAALLHCAQGQSWLRLHGLRMMEADPHPVSLTDIYVARAYRGVLDDIEGAGVAIFTLIEQRYGVAAFEIRQKITATSLNADEAAILHATAGDPALKITRHYLSDASEIYEVAINLYPADRFSYSNTLRIEQHETAS